MKSKAYTIDYYALLVSNRELYNNYIALLLIPSWAEYLLRAYFRMHQERRFPKLERRVQALEDAEKAPAEEGAGPRKKGVRKASTRSPRRDNNKGNTVAI